MAKLSRLIVRADGDSKIGAGHVMRLLALALRARRTGSDVTFLSASLAPGLAARIERLGIPIHRADVTPGSTADARWVTDAAKVQKAEWVAIDGYGYSRSYERSLHTAGLHVLTVDDVGGDGTYETDIVLNQNVFADEGMYRDRSESTRLLLGPTYALLRPEFLEGAGSSREPQEHARRILVTLGGADPEGMTGKVVSAVCRLDDPELKVVVIAGPAAEQGAALLNPGNDPRVTILGPVEEDMPTFMRDADVAVTGAGTTVYELCAVGVPALIVPLVEAQRQVAQNLGAAGLGESLSSCLADERTLATAIGDFLADPARRTMLRERGRELVDGLGAGRVIRAMAGA